MLQWRGYYVYVSCTITLISEDLLLCLHKIMNGCKDIKNIKRINKNVLFPWKVVWPNYIIIL